MSGPLIQTEIFADAALKVLPECRGTPDIVHSDAVGSCSHEFLNRSLPRASRHPVPQHGRLWLERLQEEDPRGEHPRRGQRGIPKCRQGTCFSFGRNEFWTHCDAQDKTSGKTEHVEKRDLA